MHSSSTFRYRVKEVLIPSSSTAGRLADQSIIHHLLAQGRGMHQERWPPFASPDCHFCTARIELSSGQCFFWPFFSQPLIGYPELVFDNEGLEQFGQAVIS